MDVSSEERSVCVKDNFLDRQKHLMDQLGQIEKSLNKHNNHKDSQVPKLEELTNRSQPKNKIKGFRGRQSIFKRPEGPAPRSNIRVIPDYRKNPTKWTCYSLDDVSDISNESNSEAAFSFLNELKERKKHEIKDNPKRRKIMDKLNFHPEEMEVDLDVGTSEDNVEKFTPDDQHKNVISFRKPKKVDKPIREDSKPEFRNNKIIMPEYLVGTKKTIKKKKTQKSAIEKINKNKEMKLDHLQECEDEEQ